MESKVKEAIGNSLDELGLVVDSVVYEQENGNNFLRICLDSEKVIDMNLIVEATHIINPIMDKEDLIDEPYYLDIYGKSKGSN